MGFIAAYNHTIKSYTIPSYSIHPFSTSASAPAKSICSMSRSLMYKYIRLPAPRLPRTQLFIHPRGLKFQPEPVDTSICPTISPHFGSSMSFSGLWTSALTIEIFKLGTSLFPTSVSSILVILYCKFFVM